MVRSCSNSLCFRPTWELVGVEPCRGTGAAGHAVVQVGQDQRAAREDEVDGTSAIVTAAVPAGMVRPSQVLVWK